MILNYGNIILIAFICIILIFIIYLYIDKSYLKWDNFKISQLKKFITSNNILYNDYNFLTKNLQNCFYDNFTKNISYSSFENILTIRIKSLGYDEKEKYEYLDNNNDYQTFILEILKYISICLNTTITSEIVCVHLNDKIKGDKKLCDLVANKLNEKGYTLNQFNYLDKFYIDPNTNKSDAPVIKDFVNFLNKIIK